MAAETISSPGKFWLAGEGTDLDAQTAMSGTLIIDDNGTIELKLDSGEWKHHGKTDLTSFLGLRFNLVGHLSNLNRYVRLESAFVKKPRLELEYGWAAAVISASACLLSPNLVSGQSPQACVSVLRIPFGRLWPWLDRPLPNVHQAEEHYVIDHPPDLREDFVINNGHLCIRAETTATYDLRQRATIVETESWLDFEFDDPITIEKAARLFLDIEDMMVLVTDQECGLDWPNAQTTGAVSTGTLYCWRRRTSRSDVSFFDCWVPLSKIRRFGTVVQNWLDMRETYGAAFHLYLGTRRGVSMYEEHRFINLIWGLEALHRHINEEARQPRLDTDVVARVVELVESEFKSDERRTIKKLLSQEFEPKLAHRLKLMFLELPLQFEGSTLEAFAERCGDLRNDISHYGGPRPGTSYDQFVLELHHLAGALDQLYHALILRLIGISDESLRQVFMEGPKSGQIRLRLEQAGLKLANKDGPPPTPI